MRRNYGLLSGLALIDWFIFLPAAKNPAGFGETVAISPRVFT